MDNKLKCNATNCLYNYNSLCGAEEIHVQGGQAMAGQNTFCGTFNTRSLGNYVSALGNMNYDEAAKQMFSDHPMMEPKVLCNAVNCVHNSDQVCTADAVQIQNEVSTTAEQTECQTFYPR